MLATDINKNLALKVDKSTLSDYYTATQVDSMIANKADVSVLATYAPKSTLDALTERVKKLETPATSK